jgi:hypothetical protein
VDAPKSASAAYGMFYALALAPQSGAFDTVPTVPRCQPRHPSAMSRALQCQLHAAYMLFLL